MIRPHFLDSELHQFTDDERTVIADICEAAEPDLRAALPQLQSHVNLLVEAGTTVIPETGEVGFAMAPHAIRWTVDAARDVASVAASHLRHALFHEAYHAARLVRFPEEAYATDWLSAAIGEGLATVFERDVAGFDPPWGAYDESTIRDWSAELLAQPVDHTFDHWKFHHPDGRRWIAYRVGTWLVDCAVRSAGASVSTLVWTPVDEIARLAGTSASDANR
jgi:hypothetical protein